MCQEERQTFQRHCEIHALELHALRYLQCAWREVQDRLDAGGHDLLDNLRRRGGRHGQHRDADAVALYRLPEIAHVVNGAAAARLLADFGRLRVEQRGDLEAFLPEAGIVGQRQTEIARADDGDTQLASEAENLSKMPLEIADVVADAADAELAEIREVLPDLRRVEVKLLGEGLRRDRLDAGVFERRETPQIDRQPILCQLGKPGLIEIGGFFRPFHKPTGIVAKMNYTPALWQ